MGLGCWVRTGGFACKKLDSVLSAEQGTSSTLLIDFFLTHCFLFFLLNTIAIVYFTTNRSLPNFRI